MNFIFTYNDTSLTEPEELNHWPVQHFSTWNQEKLQGKGSRKSDIDEIVFLIRAILVVKKYMHENLKHKVKKHLAKTSKSIHTFR